MRSSPNKPFTVHFITLYPQELEQALLRGVLAKAYAYDLFDVKFHDLRASSELPHQAIDDYPYGGKHGMLMRVDVLEKAIRSIPDYEEYPIMMTCPMGKTWDQRKAQSLSTKRGCIIISGYFEGVDERLYERFDVQAISIGDYGLSSGDLPAAIIAESTLRLLPDVVGKAKSVEQDSVMTGLHKHPQYTMPAAHQGLEVPELLRSGHHDKIRQWKRKKSLERSLFQAPAKLAAAPLNIEDKILLTQLLEKIRFFSYNGPLIMSNIINDIEKKQLKHNLPAINVGDTVIVSKEIIEGKKKRIQKTEGIVIKIQGAQSRKTITLRKIVDKVGVEKSFLIHSPLVSKIEVAKRGKVRRSKLYYLRNRIGKSATRIKAAD